MYIIFLSRALACNQFPFRLWLCIIIAAVDDLFQFTMRAVRDECGYWVLLSCIRGHSEWGEKLHLRERRRETIMAAAAEKNLCRQQVYEREREKYNNSLDIELVSFFLSR
jgi:hypothetical protein